MKDKKKLQLKRETLTALTETDLDAVRGAGINPMKCTFGYSGCSTAGWGKCKIAISIDGKCL